MATKETVLFPSRNYTFPIHVTLVVFARNKNEPVYFQAGLWLVTTAGERYSAVFITKLPTQ